MASNLLDLIREQNPSAARPSGCILLVASRAEPSSVSPPLSRPFLPDTGERDPSQATQNPAKDNTDAAGGVSLESFLRSDKAKGPS